MSERSQRVDHRHAFVLHARPYRETSLLVDCFTREHGLVSMVARGARRPRSETRGVLMPFQPLLVSWFGNTELKTLHKAEWQGGMLPLSGRAILCGFYLNELLVRLLPREDPHETLYEVYMRTLASLVRPQEQGIALRKFELAMLAQLGYAVPLAFEAGTDIAVLPDAWYDYFVEQGPARVTAPREGAHFRGRTLLDMARDDYRDPRTVIESRQLMRMILAHYLGGSPLNTPQILKDLQNL